jgi:hypothetical protein
MMSFLALHHIAAQRGDGLRPELVKLLERSRAITEADPASPPAVTESEDVGATRFSAAGTYHQVDLLEAARQARRGREPGPIDMQAVS